VLLSYVLRLEASGLAAGRVSGVAEAVGSGTTTIVHDVGELLAFLTATAGDGDGTTPTDGDRNE
jgi:hypothetical protein